MVGSRLNARQGTPDGATGCPSEKSISPRRVLWVEDEATLFSGFVSDLSKANFEIEFAQDFDEGLRLARTHSFDAIILDERLGPRSGLHLLHRIRSQGHCNAVLMLSAYADIRYVAEALSIGATDGRQKPVLPRELPILLEKIIAEHRAGNARKGWPHALALGPAVPLQAGEVLFSRIDLTFLARPAGEESS